MKRSSTRILTTHVGSLVRTPEIIEVMRATEGREKRPYDEQAFAQSLHTGVAEVVRKQAEVGVDVVSDGEYGKRGWTQYVRERLGGLELRELTPGERAAPPNSRIRRDFPEFWQAYTAFENDIWLPPAQGGGTAVATAPAVPTAWVCSGPITYQGQAAVQRDIANFKAALAGVQVEEAFMPCVAPCSVEVGRANQYYATEEEYLYAIAEALREEYLAIIDAGFILQVDDALLPMYWDRMAPAGTMTEFQRWGAVRQEALNHALRGIPPERVRYHICWGSQNAPHTTDVPLRDMVDLVLQVHAQAYAIEAANPRHEHEWQVWEDVKLPDGKILIPGVVTHSTNIVEHPELVAWRLQNFARLVGRENVMAGTDCGFSQNWNLVRVHPSVQWAKLAALAEGARLATQQLWQ